MEIVCNILLFVIFIGLVSVFVGFGSFDVVVCQDLGNNKTKRQRR